MSGAPFATRSVSPNSVASVVNVAEVLLGEAFRPGFGIRGVQFVRNAQIGRAHV